MQVTFGVPFVVIAIALFALVLVSRDKQRTGRVIGIVLLCLVCGFVLLVAGGVTYVAPLAWMFSTSLKTEEAVFRFPPEWFSRVPVRGAFDKPIVRFNGQRGIELRRSDQWAYVVPESALAGVHDEAGLERIAQRVPVDAVEPQRVVDMQWRNYPRAPAWRQATTLTRELPATRRWFSPRISRAAVRMFSTLTGARSPRLRFRSHRTNPRAAREASSMMSPLRNPL